MKRIGPDFRAAVEAAVLVLFLALAALAAATAAPTPIPLKIPVKKPRRLVLLFPPLSAMGISFRLMK